MPPRLGPRTAQVSGPQQCVRLQAGSNLRQARQQRDFSHSSAQQFHATSKNGTRLRRNMFVWLNGPGRAFREPLPGSTNYMGAYDRFGNLLRAKNRDQDEQSREQPGELAGEDDDPTLTEEERAQRKEAREAEAADSRSKLPREKANDLRPYPVNPMFQSQSVLSEELREEIYKKVVDEKLDVAAISATFGVDMRRVAAVVRLKTIEKDWVAQGKRLATPYASAVMEMVPQTKFNRKALEDPTKSIVHESINDLPVHPYTRQQIFYPTSESRQFTRADAAKVFSPTLLPADERIPLPELIQIERETAAGVTREQRLVSLREREDKKQKLRDDKERRQREWEAANVKLVDNQRWTFRFQNVNVEDAGKDGRGRKGVGWRYGNPHHDRKRGAVKIPTSVE